MKLIDGLPYVETYETTNYIGCPVHKPQSAKGVSERRVKRKASKDARRKNRRD